MIQHNSKNLKVRTNHKLHLAVLATFPMLAMASFNVNAACVAGNASADAHTVICNEGSTYTNPNGTTVNNTANITTASATSSVVEMVGNGSSFVNNGVLTNNATYSNTTSNAGQKYGAFIAAPSATLDTENSIINTGTISATISDANMQSNKVRLNTAAVVGVGTDAEAEYTLTNSGTISATHNGIGRVNGVEAGGDVEEMEITNSGTIIGTQAHAITKTASTATSFQGTVTLGDSSTTAAGNIGVAAGIYAEEEAVGLTINNSGTISGVGTYASGIYTRAVETEIINSGTISGTKIGVAQVSDSSEVRTMKLENTGTITGDIMSVNGSALRWWSLSNGEGTSGATLDSRLNINSQVGQADSEITNSGTITGNLYYSNGTHSLLNEDGGTITGNIDLDQRNTYGNAGAGNGNGNIIGTKNFTFENTGEFAGSITIRTATGSSINLVPTITGSGVGSSLNSPSSEISGMGGTLKFFDGTSATDGTNSTASLVTIAPKTLVTVHTGEYFKVADNLYGTALPQVDAVNTPLVNWVVAKNAGDNLVIGVNSVNSASTITGVSAKSAKAIDALMTSNTSIGATVQGLTSAAAIEKAGQQLRPEANNASMQATLANVNHLTSVIGLHQDAVRVAGNGKSGVSTGESAPTSGFWMQGVGFVGDQGSRGGINGYDVNSAGIVFGGDTLIENSDLRVGAALGYTATNVNEKEARTGNRTDIDSYQATLYGSWNAGAWYLDAVLGYGQHKYDTKRAVALNNATLTGSHDANQYLAKIGAGYPMQVGKVTFTPMTSLTYVNLDQDGYSEKDSSNTGAGLTVKGTNVDSFRSGLGAKISAPLSEGDLKSSIEARAIWNHEFADTKQDVAARFAGGTSFTTNGVSQARDSANLGLGLSMSGNGQTLSANYDAEVRSSYVGHTASVKFRYDF